MCGLYLCIYKYVWKPINKTGSCNFMKLARVHFETEKPRVKCPHWCPYWCPCYNLSQPSVMLKVSTKLYKGKFLALGHEYLHTKNNDCVCSLMRFCTFHLMDMPFKCLEIRRDHPQLLVSIYLPPFPWGGRVSGSAESIHIIPRMT